MSDEEICNRSTSEDEEHNEQSIGTNDSGSQNTQTGKYAHGQSVELGLSKRQSSQTDNAILKELKRLTSSIQRMEDQVYYLESKGSRSSPPWPSKKRRAPESHTPGCPAAGPIVKMTVTELTTVNIWTGHMMRTVLQSLPPLSHCQRTTLPSSRPP